MNIGLTVNYKTRVMDAATGKCIKDNPWRKNLVLDTGLNALAQSTNPSTPASSFGSCKIGGGTNANRFQNGGITFTAIASTTVNASGGFFTSAMVGAIIKFGTTTAGPEYYITAFTSSTTVTIDTAITQIAQQATVWMVQQTALQTLLYESTTYQTNSGDCITTYSSPNVIMQRTFVFPTQVSTYTVNEIGWGRVATTCFGRAVLTSSDVVAPTSFYVVIVTITYNYSPAAPTAVIDVGTGINTAGNAMTECWSLSQVTSAGTNGNPPSGMGTALDATTAVFGFIPQSTYTQLSAIGATGGVTRPALRFDLTGVGVSWAYGSARGKMTLTFTNTFSVAGETIYGICIQSNLTPFSMVWDVKFTTAVTLPTGTWTPTIVFQVIYGRTLDNA